MPVSRESSDELSGPLVHQISPENKAPKDWSIQISPEIHMPMAPKSLRRSPGFSRKVSCPKSSCLSLLKIKSHRTWRKGALVIHWGQANRGEWQGIQCGYGLAGVTDLHVFRL